MKMNMRTQWLFGISWIGRVKNLHYQTMFTLSSLLFTKKKFQAGSCSVFSPLPSLFFSALLFTRFFLLCFSLHINNSFCSGNAFCLGVKKHVVYLRKCILVAVDWHGPASFQNEYTVYRGKSRAHPRYFTSKIPG